MIVIGQNLVFVSEVTDNADSVKTIPFVQFQYSSDNLGRNERRLSKF